MRKGFLFIVALLLSLAAFAQDKTPNLHLNLQPKGAKNWDEPLNANFWLIDSRLAAEPVTSVFGRGGAILPSPGDYSVDQITGAAPLTSPHFLGVPWAPTADVDDVSQQIVNTEFLSKYRLAHRPQWSELLGTPTVFPPSLPTASAPGGVFTPANCPTGSHFSGVNNTNGQLLCTSDATFPLAVQVNGVDVASGAGIKTIDFVGSSGLIITAAYNQTTGHITFTITGSTATQAQIPVFNPLPGKYAAGQTVELTCASPTPTVYYTTDGSDPSHSSTAFEAPLAVSNTTLKALCASAGLADSNIMTGVYEVRTPIVSLLPSSLSYGTVKVGVASATQSVTLFNSGDGTLSIFSIAGSGDFSESNSCGGTLTAGNSCLISVTFTPTAVGSRSGSLTVTDNASGSPHTVSLSGTGAVATTTLSPSSLTFGTYNIGTSSPSQSITVTNTSAVAMVISSIGITGDYAQINNCGSSLAPSANCSITVTFTPTAAGSRAGILTVTDDASGSPHTAGLVGTGQTALPVVSLTPTSLAFGNVAVNRTSNLTATLTNTGTASLTISSITASGTYFSQTNNCGASLAPNASCTINAMFTPLALGAQTGSVTITDNASGSPHTISLSGTGIGQGAVTLSATTLDFPDVPIGSRYDDIITVTNSGNASLSITSISITGSAYFSQTNDCGNSLGPAAHCTITVTFNCTSTIRRTGTLLLVDSASDSPQRVALSGNGPPIAP